MGVSMTSIFVLSASATLGILLVVLACALPSYDNAWPLLVLLTYFFAPLPFILSKRCGESDSYMDNGSVSRDVMLFCTASIVVSGFGIPLVLMHQGTIAAGQCWLTFGGNGIIFLTILAYFKVMSDADDGW